MFACQFHRRWYESILVQRNAFSFWRLFSIFSSVCPCFLVASLIFIPAASMVFFNTPAVKTLLLSMKMVIETYFCQVNIEMKLFIDIWASACLKVIAIMYLEKLSTAVRMCFRPFDVEQALQRCSRACLLIGCKRL